VTGDNFSFGLVRSTRSALGGSTEISRKPLIVFDFSNHRLRHCKHRFGRRFGIKKQKDSTVKNSWKICVLRRPLDRVASTVNP